MKIKIGIERNNSELIIVDISRIRNLGRRRILPQLLSREYTGAVERQLATEDKGRLPSVKLKYLSEIFKGNIFIYKDY